MYLQIYPLSLWYVELYLGSKQYDPPGGSATSPICHYIHRRCTAAFALPQFVQDLPPSGQTVRDPMQPKYRSTFGRRQAETFAGLPGALDDGELRPGTRRGPEAIRLPPGCWRNLACTKNGSKKKCILPISVTWLCRLEGSNALLAPSRPPSETWPKTAGTVYPRWRTPAHVAGVQGLTAVHGSILPCRNLMPMPICGPNMRAKYCPTVMRQLAEVVPPGNIYQFGIRPPPPPKCLMLAPHPLFPSKCWSRWLRRLSLGTGWCGHDIDV